jgi:hypothetical protein
MPSLARLRSYFVFSRHGFMTPCTNLHWFAGCAFVSLRHYLTPARISPYLGSFMVCPNESLQAMVSITWPSRLSFKCVFYLFYYLSTSTRLRYYLILSFLHTLKLNFIAQGKEQVHGMERILSSNAHYWITFSTRRD